MELYDKMTDEELIGKLRAGRRDVADYLMEKYKGLVRQKARTMYLIGYLYLKEDWERMLDLIRAGLEGRKS